MIVNGRTLTIVYRSLPQSVMALMVKMLDKDSDLYRLYNTNIHEKIAQGLMGEGKTSVNADQQMNVENQSKSWLIRGLKPRFSLP